MPDLLLLRHGQSTWNASGRWQGWADPPLSAEGEQQARRAADRLVGVPPFDLVVSSDLLRARRTATLLAEALGLSLPLTIEPELREYDLGEWSGCTIEDIESRWPGDLARFRQGDFAPPAAETRAEFDRRLTLASERVAAEASTGGFAHLLVVAHGGVVRALARSAGVAEYRVSHLAGYWGTSGEGRLRPEEPVNLLDTAVVPVSDEASIAPAR